MSEKLYIRPTGFVWGDTATEAIAQGMALPVAGELAACLGYELIEGAPGAAKRQLVHARDLSASADVQIKALLHRVTRSRAPVAGLTFERPRIMGIVNVTPDSFSDGGDFETAQTAVAQARCLAHEGADIVDVGGESTRPGSEAVDETEEMRRVLPVIEDLLDLGKAISIDTRKAPIMEAGVRSGATIINDVSALTHDPLTPETAARLKVPIVLMHAKGDPKTMQDNPVYEDVLLEVYDFLEARIVAAEKAGIPRSMLIADPGIGFGKTVEHNLVLLRGISLFHGLGVPLLLGASRKRFIGTITGEGDPKRRGPGSIGVALAAAAQAVQLFRVHNVAETRHALDCWFASILGSY